MEVDGKVLAFNDGFYADGSPAPRDGSIKDGLALLDQADTLVGHNIIGFDFLALYKVYGWLPPTKARIRDTLIWARMCFPDIATRDQLAMVRGKRPPEFTGKMVGAHTLKAWGMRLKVMKGDFEGPWGDFTPEMDLYARNDPVVTRALRVALEAREYSEEALDLEMEVARIIAMQERNGFSFDEEKARVLEGVLRGRHAELGDQLRAAFPPWEEPVRKGGKPVIFVPKRDNAKLGYTAGVGVPKFKTVSFNPASRDHIANRMQTLFGWAPSEFTDGGKPKVDETTLANLEYPEAKLLVEYLTIEKRLGQLADGKEAWLKNSRDGRIHGRVNTVGAVTRRMTHSKPNVPQVPSIENASGKVPYGKECRELFKASAGMVLVGVDAEGLELRELAHYMARFDGGKYADTVVNGDKSLGTDVHTVNQKIIGLNSRNAAKTFIYGYMYGAGNFKLGTIMFDDMKPETRTAFLTKYPEGAARESALVRMGKKARDRIESGLPALGKLQARVKEAAKRGYIKTHDGGKIKVRSQHSALNSVLQSGGAVVCKMALVIFERQLREVAGFIPNPLTGRYTHPDGGQFGLTANVHDEWQTESTPEWADYIAEAGKRSIKLAGEVFKLKCPLAGSADIGANWAATH